jgi:hypothetical protein
MTPSRSTPACAMEMAIHANLAALALQRKHPASPARAAA